MHILRGIVDGYDPVTHTVDVRLDGATGRMDGVPALRVIPSDELTAGDRVVVAVWPDVGAVVLGSFDD